MWMFWRRRLCAPGDSGRCFHRPVRPVRFVFRAQFHRLPADQDSLAWKRQPASSPRVFPTDGHWKWSTQQQQHSRQTVGHSRGSRNPDQDRNGGHPDVDCWSDVALHHGLSLISFSFVSSTCAGSSTNRIAATSTGWRPTWKNWDSFTPCTILSFSSWGARRWWRPWRFMIHFESYIENNQRHRWRK